MSDQIVTIAAAGIAFTDLNLSPVEPEVNRIVASSSGPTSGSTASAIGWSSTRASNGASASSSGNSISSVRRS